MRRFHIYIGFIVWLLTSLFAVSCNDELEGNGYTLNSSSNLHVLVPTVLSSRGTRTDDASGLPTYNATVDECQINDLTLYAFPTGNEGKLLVETLPAPLATMMVEQHVANYQLNIEPGTYHIYVVANMNKVLSGKTIKTEDDLKKIVLSYGVGTEPGMPVSTNIPMIYEPKDVNGNIIDTKIEKSGNKYTEVAANLKFTCVKVKLNLIMDPTASDNLYGKSYSITDIVAEKLTPSTHLLWDGKFTQSESDVTSVYATGIENTIYSSSSTGEASTGRYYQNGEYTINEDNKNVANEDVVKIADAYKDKGTLNPTNIKQWLFQGTYYLPERYISKVEEQSVLKINGIVNSSNKNQYTINLGHKQNASDALPTFPRGTYYEITGKLKSYGDMDLDCDVKVDDWKPVEINADFYHTTLWVNKTKANVTSTKGDTISYNSSEPDVTFGCIDTKTVGEKDEKVIILTKNDGKNIIFGINPEIPITEFPKNERKGTARVYLQANNIKKYIEVHYDVTPYFKVSPKNVVIYWGKDPDDKQVLEKHFVVETNLGGLKAFQNINGTPTEIASGSIAQVGNAPSRLKISYDNTPDADGKYLMKVTETQNPVTTTVYNFTLSPLNQISGDEIASQEVTVTVKPEFGPYRIYMRAINNICNWDGKEDGTANLDVVFAEQKTEYTGKNGSYNDNYNFNWYDGWTDKDVSKNENNEDNKRIQNGRHKMYMYTQLGENDNNSTTVKDDAYVWIFSEKFPGDQMTGDVNNAGWYYKDMPFNAESKFAENKATGTTKQIKPGQTLVIFGTGENVGNGVTGCTPHRFPHTMDPGIPLFNYEDREGWYLYDPTCIPYYRVYDDKPTIINVDYVIYTKSDITKWKIDFGKKNNKFDSYTLECNSDKFKQKSEEVGNGWYRTVLNFKAPKGEYEKAIMVSISGNNDQMLFGGDSYPCIYDAATKQYQIFGYYDGSWHDGKPSGVSK